MVDSHKVNYNWWQTFWAGVR